MAAKPTRPKSQVDTDDQYFAALAGVGVTVFASSGDGGSTPGTASAGDETGPLQVESPASDPYVTGVGGTSLTLNSNGSEKREVVWNNGTGATGGGTSIYFSRPSWQTGTGVPGGTMRTVPDVACPADPNTGAVLYYDGGQTIVGGTSWSSPTWAGYCALINQARANAGLPSIGLLGPNIYPLILTANFRDITVGNNATAKSGGLYSAGAGYDETTGIGVPLMQDPDRHPGGNSHPAPSANQRGFSGHRPWTKCHDLHHLHRQPCLLPMATDADRHVYLEQSYH